MDPLFFYKYPHTLCVYRHPYTSHHTNIGRKHISFIFCPWELQYTTINIEKNEQKKISQSFQ